MTDAVSDEPESVLVVDDEANLADLYSDYLRDSYDVRTAYSGEDALEMLSDDLDVVLLDRRMPVVSGGQVLADIEQRDYDVRVALVTAVNPDFEIIDLQIDDYLVKPIKRDDLRETVERLLIIEEYNDRMQELTAKKLKRNVLEREKTRAELQESDDFQQLVDDIEQLETTVETIADELDVENLEQYL